MKRIVVIFLAVLLSVIPVASLNSQTVKAETSTGGWTKTYGGTSGDYAQALVQTSDGGYALAGRTTSYGAGDPDFWLVKTKADGTVQDWSPDLVLIALVAAVIVVVILLAVILMRRKSQRSPPNSIRFSNQVGAC